MAMINRLSLAVAAIAVLAPVSHSLAIIRNNCRKQMYVWHHPGDDDFYPIPPGDEYAEHFIKGTDENPGIALKVSSQEDGIFTGLGDEVDLEYFLNETAQEVWVHTAIIRPKDGPLPYENGIRVTDCTGTYVPKNEGGNATPETHVCPSSSSYKLVLCTPDLEEPRNVMKMSAVSKACVSRRQVDPEEDPEELDDSWSTDDEGLLSGVQEVRQHCVFEFVYDDEIVHDPQELVDSVMDVIEKGSANPATTTITLNGVTVTVNPPDSSTSSSSPKSSSASATPASSASSKSSSSASSKSSPSDNATPASASASSTSSSASSKSSSKSSSSDNATPASASASSSSSPASSKSSSKSSSSDNATPASASASSTSSSASSKSSSKSSSSDNATPASASASSTSSSTSSKSSSKSSTSDNPTPEAASASSTSTSTSSKSSSPAAASASASGGRKQVTSAKNIATVTKTTFTTLVKTAHVTHSSPSAAAKRETSEPISSFSEIEIPVTSQPAKESEDKSSFSEIEIPVTSQDKSASAPTSFSEIEISVTSQVPPAKESEDKSSFSEILIPVTSQAPPAMEREDKSTALIAVSSQHRSADKTGAQSAPTLTKIEVSSQHRSAEETGDKSAPTPAPVSIVLSSQDHHTKSQ